MLRGGHMLGRPALILFAALLTSSSAVYGQQLPSPDVGAVRRVPNPVCSNPDVLARIQQRESALLGARHAAEHARVRIRQCEMAMGLTQSSGSKVPGTPSSQSASVIGGWSDPFVIPVMGITSVLLHTGKVLFWSYDPNDWLNPAASNTGVAYLWDPVSRTGTSIAAPENIWCGGQTVLRNGSVYVAGGNLRYPDSNAPPGETGWEGALSNYTFNPNARTWTRQPDMSVGRWYPTVTKLSDGRAVITSGYDQSGTNTLTQTVEVFTPPANIDGIGNLSVVSQHDPSGLYPLQFLLSSGRMLQAGPIANNTYLLDSATWNWSAIPNLRSSHDGYGNGIIYIDASVSPSKQIVMVAGGADGSTAIANNEWLDVTNPSSGWKAFPQWAQARHNANTVILPNGSLITIGGNSAPTNFDNAVFGSELYNKPAGDPSGSWVQVAANTVQAAYHSSALLLPDATVLLSQDDMLPQYQGASAAETHKAQIYSPPYLFQGTRPKITGVPSELKLGQTFTFKSDSSKIATISLVAPGAVTHANDMHQRFIKLQATVNGPNIQATIPVSAGMVPPGYYMLFAVDSKGIPSVAQFVHIT